MEKEYPNDVDLQSHMEVVESQQRYLHDEKNVGGIRRKRIANTTSRYENIGEFYEEVERQEIINNVCEKRKQIIDNYFNESKEIAHQSFEKIPADVLEYLIPKRLMEIVQDSSNIRISATFQRKDEMHLTIEYAPLGEKSSKKALIKVLLELNPTPDVVFVNSYNDPEIEKGQGVGSEFYQRLEYLVRKLGCTYVTGDCDEFNYERFYKKIGRKLWREADKALRERLRPHHWDSTLTDFTYKEL